MSSIVHLYAGAGAIDVLILIFVGWKLRHRFNLHWPFGRDDRGAVAIEFAIVFPVMLAMMFGVFVTWQALNQQSTTAFVAQACAAAGRTVLNQKDNGGLPAVQTAAQQVYNSNTGLFIFGATPTLQSVTLDGNGNVAVTVSASATPLFPIGGTITTTVTATD